MSNYKKNTDSDDIFDVFDIKPKKENANKKITIVKKENEEIKETKKQTQQEISDDEFDEMNEVFGVKLQKTANKREKNDVNGVFGMGFWKEKDITKDIKIKDNQYKLICSHSQKQYIITRPTYPNLYPFGTSWFYDNNTGDDELSEQQKSLSKKVKKLLEIEYPAQRSKAWFDMRKGCISASDGGCVVGDNQHEPQYAIYLKKLLEPPFEPNGACYHGTKLEQVATMVYEYRMNVRVEEFGLVKHPSIKCIGASPDGIIGKYKLNGKDKTKFVGRMLEIKCPKSREINDDNPFDHIKYYWVQVQLQLECCDLEECDFWQNVIREYDTRQDFIDDTDEKEPFRSKKTGAEKGCLIQLLPKDKMGDITNEVIWGFSKFLYPSKIDMTPLECDVWVTEVANNLEAYLINNIYDKYKDMKELIINSIKSAKFKMYYVNEIKAKVESLVSWLVNEKHVKITEDKKSNFFTKKSIELEEEYLKNIPKKLQEEKFIRFLVNCNLQKYDDIKQDEKLYEKILDLDLDENFGKHVNTNKDLKFIKELSRFLKEFEFPRKYGFHRVYYWRVEKTNCELVKRDREWFKQKLPIFEKMWKNIEFLREHQDYVSVLQQYINSLPTKEVHFGKEIKDNNKVMDFVDYLCNPPKEEKELKKYNKKIKELLEK